MITAIDDGNAIIGVESTNDDGVKSRRIVFPGSVIGGTWKDADISGESQEVKDLAARLWTQSAVAAFRDMALLQYHSPSRNDYAAAVQARVDAVARARQYNDAATLAGYATDPNAAFASDAASFIAWRSAVWVYANEQLALVLTGQRAQPSVEQLVGELPVPPWPVP